MSARVGPPTSGKRTLWRWAAFPGAVLSALLILVGLNLNGSSIALLSVDRPAPGLIAGTPRSIRSDEWWLKTPISVSSVRQGLPPDQWIGLSPVDQSATAHGGPTRDWTTLLRPQDWGYLVLGESRGLAASWWWPSTIGLVGCFTLLGFLTRRPLLSGVLSVAAVFTPYAGWWSAPPPQLFLGYAALAGAFLLMAWTVERPRQAAAFSLAAGLSGAALGLALYPPWQVSLGWVVLAVCLGYALDARIGWRRFLWPIVSAALTTAAVLAVWYLQHKPAIAAQVATYYPGHRISVPGTASLSTLVDGPLNFWMTGSTGTTLGHTGKVVAPTNLSEAASTWLPLPVAALIVLGVVELGLRAARRRLTGRTPTRDSRVPSASVTTAAGQPPLAAPIWTLASVAGALGLLLAWALLDLPEVVGRVTMLQRVEPTRTPLALGFALILLVALATQVSGLRPMAWTWPGLVLAAAASVASTMWSDDRLPWDGSSTPTLLVVLSGLAVGGAFVALLHHRLRLLAGVALAVYAFTSWVLVNPLQHGLDPVNRDPLVRTLDRVTSESSNPRVAVFAPMASSFATVAKVRVAGLQSLTGTTLYPNARLMQALVPRQERLWNNYAYYVWVPAPPGASPVITQIRGTLMSLKVPVCHPVLLSGTEPGWVVSDTKLKAPCLRRAAVVEGAAPTRLWLYRVVA